MPVYIFDNNSISSILKYYYTDQFPTFWEKFEEKIKNGSVISVREVKHELEEYFDDSKIELISKHSIDFFQQPTTDELSFITDIYRVDHFRQNLEKKKILKGGPFADPFIVAKAKIKDGIVVTEEEHKPSAAKIPNICDHFGIEVINLEGFLKRENWIF